MNRSDIIKHISELYPKLGRKEVDLLVKELFGKLSSSLSDGKRIEIRGFGCFSLKHRAAGKVRNPRHGVAVDSGERHVVYFRAGKELRERVDVYSR
ncbi:MAG: integration host factor subunit beta [Neisseriaceae bacterium]|jgi:integration host factor subunit beta|nr:MAG: integration host factor subunit beta [Neisseriaceae bacterium]